MGGPASRRRRRCRRPGGAGCDRRPRYRAAWWRGLWPAAVPWCRALRWTPSRC